MRFEDVALAAFLLAMFFIVYHDIDYMTGNHNSNIATSVSHETLSANNAGFVPVDDRK